MSEYIHVPVSLRKQGALTQSLPRAYGHVMFKPRPSPFFAWSAPMYNYFARVNGEGLGSKASTNGKSDKLSHSSDVVDPCKCVCTHYNVDLHVNVWLRPLLWVCGQWLWQPLEYFK